MHSSSRALVASLALLTIITLPAEAQTPQSKGDTARIRGDTIWARQPKRDGYAATRTRSATRTDTPLRDIPQAIAIVTRPLMQDRAMRGLADVVTYLPGVGMSHGEGNRDAPVLRGNTSTGDLFVDGLRDDVQYFRDLYNIERVEAVKGPDAMIFGRGGAGGILNRVTKQADVAPIRAVELQGGAWNERRVTGDVGDALTPTLAARVNAVLEQDDSFRASVNSRREGLAPTLTWRAAPRTTLRAGLEYYRDDRTADRGVPSRLGLPLDLDNDVARTFFGNPAVSRSAITAHLLNVAVSHAFGGGTRLESRLLAGDYDKFYRNVYAASAVDTARGTVQLGAYDNATTRRNVSWQTDLTGLRTTGPLTHRWLVGFEAVRQATDNVRRTGFFGDTATTLGVPALAPTVAGAMTWRPASGDATNTGVAVALALSAQDELVVTPWLRAVLGLRVDRFHIDMTDRRTTTALASRDLELSPRVGLIVKPVESVSLYGSWSRSFVPRGGDQLASLTITNQALAPEAFVNAEVGLKWDPREDLALTVATYQLDRRNVIVPDPVNPARSTLAAAQRTRGVELGLNGQLTPWWHVAGGYTFTDGRFMQAVSGAVPAGNVVANLPRHVLTLWQRVDLSPRVGLGLGAQRQSSMYAATDNAVRLPGFTRVDGALYLKLGGNWSTQLNVENLLDARYIVAANTNNNLLPATPRMARMVLRAAW
jgi:catecholate siderophore receptor